MRLQGNPDGFQFGKFFQRVQGLIATVAALLIAAKGYGHVTVVIVIDEDRACFQTAAHAVRAGKIAGPYRRAKPIFTVIGQR